MKPGRPTLRIFVALATALSLGACSSSSKTPGSGSSDPSEDVVFLTDGKVVRGKIVSETSDSVTVSRSGRRVEIAKSTVYAVERSEATEGAREAAALRPASPASAATPVSGWYPRQRADEGIRQTEVTWSDTKTLEDILGKEFAASFAKFPDFRLFAVPGGKIVFHDPRRWGYRAYVVKPNALHKPEKDSGKLDVAMPEEKDLPEAIAFLSPAQEMKSTEVEKRSSYTIPDCVYSKILPESQSQAMLAVQPFAGGKPAKGPNGDLWAFSLSRGISNWFLYVHDNPQRSHAKIMKTLFAAYGDTLLVPEAMIDVEAPDGTVTSRVMVLPYPDDVPLDGSAPDPVTVYSGPPTDPTVVTTVALPSRQNIVLPTRRPSTKADIWVQHYDILPNIPQSIVVAHGFGDPAAQVTLVERELTQDKADERLRFDASSYPEERFPMVAWIYTRRIVAWRTNSGMLPRVAPLMVPPLAAPNKITRFKSNPGVSHVIPLMFAGPKPASDGGAGAAAATGMGSSLLGDALSREAGRNLFTPNLSVPVGTGGGGGSQNNITNLTVVVPPHTASTSSYGGSTSLPPSGMYLYQQPGYPSNVGVLPNGPVGAMGPIRGTTDGSVYRDPSGNVLYDPATGFNYTDYYLQGGGAGGAGQSVGIGIPGFPGGGTYNVPIRRQQTRQ